MKIPQTKGSYRCHLPVHGPQQGKGYLEGGEVIVRGSATNDGPPNTGANLLSSTFGYYDSYNKHSVPAYGGSVDLGNGVSLHGQYQSPGNGRQDNAGGAIKFIKRF